jgi:hypothetical protein
MSSLITQVKAKQRKEAEEKARRLELRRVAQIRRRAAVKADGLDDLPLEVALAIESSSPPVEPEPAPAPDDSVESLVARLTAIRERIWMLQAVFATSLSQETAIAANGYLALFQTIAEQLRAKDPSALESLVRGHESLLQAPALPIRPSIPLSTQQFVQMRWEAMTQPTRRPPKQPSGYVPDGLQSFL